MVEKVREPLTKFLFDSLKSKREIDESFIAEVIEIVVNALGLNEYVRGYKINNEPWDGSDIINTAYYSVISKKIVFELQATIEFYKYVSRNIKLDTFEKITFIYDKVVVTLLHELEHAHQYKKMNSSDTSLENTILGYASVPFFLLQQYDILIKDGFTHQQVFDLIVEKSNIAKKYYDYDPIERLSEYYSHKTMATILKELGNLPGISYYECLKLCQNYIKGYIDGVTPTEFYFSVLGISEFWPRIEEDSRNLDFESRVSLGLSISYHEYEYLEDTTNALGRKVLK